MKIKFTKLPTTNGTIKVSLDGGDSFKDYNIADIHKSGVPLSDSQDYEKIQVKAPANVLKNLDIVASVKVEGEGAETGSTNEPIFIMDTDTYGFEFPNFVTGIIIPNGATTIGKNVFGNYPNLQTIVIPEGVTSIGQTAFSYCRSLTSITIPEGVTSIGQSAFQNCSSLTSITIPESVTSIGNEAFYYCSKLTSITIPESVTSIGINAFCNCSRLTSITIPEGVTSIGSNAFYYCSKLTSVTIPESVTSIGNYAFSYCSSLKTINYTGTEEQWNAISKGTNWNYETSLNVIYNYKPE